jgi:uncharacterized cupredoxin-like copper-binding protein
MRHSSQGCSRFGGLLFAIVLLGVLLGASTGWSRSGGAALVTVTERDFAIKAPPSVRAGQIRLRLRNEGPDTHELIVARVRRERLPLRADGLTVDEEALEPLHPVTIEGLERGGNEEVRVKLVPGRYVLFCNMAGHYLSGMHATLVVR